MLEEIRRQEQILVDADKKMPADEEAQPTFDSGVVEGDTGQTTLFGGDV